MFGLLAVSSSDAHAQAAGCEAATFDTQIEPDQVVLTPGDEGRSCDEDEAVVRVSTCSWMVIYDGIMYRGDAGDRASFVGSPGGYTIGLENEDGSHVFLTSNQMEGDAVTGNMGVSGNQQWGSFYAYEDPKIPISIFLDRNGDGVVAGRASGTVKVMDPSIGIVGRASFSAEFMIADVASAADANPGQIGALPGLEQLGNFLSDDQRAELEAQMRQYEGMMDGLPMTPLSCEISE